MPACRGCQLRTRDFGGRRCQAHPLTGDATQADPACRLSPDQALVRDVVDRPDSVLPAVLGYLYRKEGP